MPKRATPLTAVQVRTAKPGVHIDGGGLMLMVKPTGAAAWTFRYTAGGRRRDMGLGAARGPYAIGLAEAREKAAEARKLVAAGIDPLAARDAEEETRAAAEAAAKLAAERQAMTFTAAADRFLAAHEPGWRNAKHRAQWSMTLREYAAPHFGAVPVAEVATHHIEAALRPLWHEKTETASRLRGRIEAVLDYATVHGWREGANPARWRGHLDKLFPRRAKVRVVAHHAALAWQDVPAFIKALRAREGASARALEFAILTAARSGEVLGARWREFDLDAGLWTIPAARMKAGREHRVPLSAPALAVLAGMLDSRPAGDADPLVFPGAQKGKPLSSMAMMMVLRRMNTARAGQAPRWRDPVTGEAVTPHGFRSTFRDWAGETTAHPREVVEHALAHRLGDRVEQAYARGDLFAKRRRLMDEWAAFCGRPPAGVVPLRDAPVDVAAS